jgi:hypothetical protein
MNRYWFKPKRYGYGASPITWEGWALTVACVAGVLTAMLLMLPWGQRIYDDQWIAFFAVVGVIIGGSVFISRWKTDGEWRWRWGNEQN